MNIFTVVGKFSSPNYATACLVGDDGAHVLPGHPGEVVLGLDGLSDEVAHDDAAHDGQLRHTAVRAQRQHRAHHLHLGERLAHVGLRLTRHQRQLGAQVLALQAGVEHALGRRAVARVAQRVDVGVLRAVQLQLAVDLDEALGRDQARVQLLDELRRGAEAAAQQLHVRLDLRALVRAQRALLEAVARQALRQALAQHHLDTQALEVRRQLGAELVAHVVARHQLVLALEDCHGLARVPGLDLAGHLDAHGTAAHDEHAAGSLDLLAHLGQLGLRGRALEVVGRLLDGHRVRAARGHDQVVVAQALDGASQQVSVLADGRVLNLVGAGHDARHDGALDLNEGLGRRRDDAVVRHEELLGVGGVHDGARRAHGVVVVLALLEHEHLGVVLGREVGRQRLRHGDARGAATDDEDARHGVCVWEWRDRKGGEEALRLRDDNEGLWSERVKHCHNPRFGLSLATATATWCAPKKQCSGRPEQQQQKYRGWQQTGDAGIGFHQPFGLSVQSAMGRPRTTGTGKNPKRYTRIAVDYTHKRCLLEFLAAGYSVNEAIAHVYPNCSRQTVCSDDDYSSSSDDEFF
ncbi:hypothetical protein ON010_g4152 [Phytophthora cinnamomi]|nr:hypothetical protein ON010_g4152 [Phytophthora cinnamomi]